ncbi:MAG: hypothetical protein QGH37_20225 [Candidatus Poribacteria bacterium]|nr:hypothetical protein [Candidatus Poribacteria bacterium]
MRLVSSARLCVATDSVSCGSCAGENRPSAVLISELPYRFKKRPHVLDGGLRHNTIAWRSNVPTLWSVKVRHERLYLTANGFAIPSHQVELDVNSAEIT